jgi:hypothetical protein
VEPPFNEAAVEVLERMNHLVVAVLVVVVAVVLVVAQLTVPQARQTMAAVVGAVVEPPLKQRLVVLVVRV